MSGVLLALLAAALWAVASVMLMVGAKRLHIVPLNLVRCAVTAAFCLILLPWHGGLSALAGLSWLNWLLLGVTVLANLVIGDTLFFRGMDLAGVSWAMPVAGVNPLWSVLLAAAFIGEPLTWSLLAGAALVVAGILLISRPVGQGASPRSGRGSRGSSADPASWRRGMVLAAGASVLWAIGNVTIKPATKGMDVVLANAARLSMAAVVLLVLSLRRGRWRELLVLDKRSWGVIVVAGLLGTGVGALLFVTAIQQIGAGRTSILVSTAPMMAIPFSMLWLGERPTRWTILGTVLTTAGIVLVA